MKRAKPKRENKEAFCGKNIFINYDTKHNPLRSQSAVEY
jgi:hypothetical protein